MNTPLWVTELATEFWHLAGDAGPFPRDLRRAVHRATPLSVKFLPSLTVQRVRAWLANLGVPCAVPDGDRPLRACLFARDSCGFIFLDAADPEAEYQFSLAHEIGHFQRHYRQPRRRAVAHLGAGILDVFDGRRQPTAEERLHALLRGVRVGAHWHLLGRDEGRRSASAAIVTAENEADRLGCELLAPAALVLQQTRRSTMNAARREAEWQLQTAFGLPRSEAVAYACRLYPPLHDPLLRRLGISS